MWGTRTLNIEEESFYKDIFADYKTVTDVLFILIVY